jgi:hypothetical protein
MNALELAQKHVMLRKVSQTNGGEWQGPCPLCGGTDRFHVWPEQQEGKGSYWCRGCGVSGDNIQFLIDVEGMTYRDACSRLNIAPDLHFKPHLDRPRPPADTWRPTESIPPSDLWQDKAIRFISWASENLSRDENQLSWLASRGITSQAVQEYRIGWNTGENGKDLYRPRKSWGLPEVMKDDGRPKMLWIPRGLVIPYLIDGIVHRIRIRRPEGEPRYYVLPGSSMVTMLLGATRRAFVIVESELDAIAVMASGSPAGAVALGSVSAKPDAASFAALSRALQILNALDCDAAGARAMAWWSDHFQRCDRWPVPQGKDPGDAVRMGTDLKKWIGAGLPPALTLGDQAPPRPAVNREAGPLPESDSKLPEELAELWNLLKQNQGVEIINTPRRYTVLRNGKYVGGRINELVFRVPVTRDYLLSHQEEKITWRNLIP